MTLVDTYEFFYTGGGVWNIEGRLTTGEYFAGECYENPAYRDHRLCLYRAKESEERNSWECFDESDPDFIGEYDLTDERTRNVWREVYEREIAKRDYTLDLVERKIREVLA